MTAGNGEDFDVAGAADLVKATENSFVRAVDVRADRQYFAWGVAWLLGLGLMWLNVLAQQPFVGPSGWTTIVLIVLLVLALAVTGISIGGATAGLGGINAFRGKIFGTAWTVGFAGLWLGLYAVSLHTDGLPGMLNGAAAMGLTGLIYLLGAGLWADRLMTVLGVWLVAVAVGGAFAGPIWLLGLGAFAGGGGFLVAAALARRRRGH